MEVKNLNGTSANTCGKCGTWINHWQNLSGKEALLCGRKDCTGIAELGAHVQKVSGDTAWYIVPLCSDCNHISSDETFEIDSDTPLIRAVACN